MFGNRFGQTIRLHFQTFLGILPNNGGQMKFDFSTSASSLMLYGSYAIQSLQNETAKMRTKFFPFLLQDMNEVANFDTNQYSDKLYCPPNQWDDPPYETSTECS